MRAEDMLPDDTDEVQVSGTNVRKGTVGAFLANVAVLLDQGTSEAERADAENDIRDAVPALKALGLLDVFEARDERVRSLLR